RLQAVDPAAHLAGPRESKRRGLDVARARLVEGPTPDRARAAKPTRVPASVRDRVAAAPRSASRREPMADAKPHSQRCVLDIAQTRRLGEACPACNLIDPELLSPNTKL